MEGALAGIQASEEASVKREALEKALGEAIDAERWGSWLARYAQDANATRVRLANPEYILRTVPLQEISALAVRFCYDFKNFKNKQGSIQNRRREFVFLKHEKRFILGCAKVFQAFDRDQDRRRSSPLPL